MKTTPEIIERLELIIRESGLSRRQFSLILGRPVSEFFEIYAGRIKLLSDEFVQALELKFDINPEWLKTGRGPRKKNGKENGKEK